MSFFLSFPCSLSAPFLAFRPSLGACETQGRLARNSRVWCGTAYRQRDRRYSRLSACLAPLACGFAASLLISFPLDLCAASVSRHLRLFFRILLFHPWCSMSVCLQASRSGQHIVVRDGQAVFVYWYFL